MFEDPGDMLHWLWAVLALPLGWLWKRTQANDESIEKVKEMVSKQAVYNANHFVRTEDLKDLSAQLRTDTLTLSLDIKELKTLIMKQALKSSQED